MSSPWSSVGSSANAEETRWGQLGLSGSRSSFHERGEMSTGSERSHCPVLAASLSILGHPVEICHLLYFQALVRLEGINFLLELV